MQREELEKVIENGESVWIIGKDYQGNFKIAGLQLHKDKIFNNRLNGFWELNKIFKTKAEAEHYLHHANITRTEQLPFLTWEEFKNGKNITFKAKNGHEFLLKAKQESIYLWWLDTNNIWANWDLTEENFYKAYDECVRLFRSE